MSKYICGGEGMSNIVIETLKRKKGIPIDGIVRGGVQIVFRFIGLNQRKVSAGRDVLDSIRFVILYSAA